MSATIKTDTPHTSRFHIVTMPGTDDRYMSISIYGTKITDCFGYGFKNRFTAYNGTIYFIKKRKSWKKNQKK